jgi:hypothetical protein
VQAAGNAEPIPFNRVGDAGSIGLDRTQVVERLPSLRLAAGRLIEFAQDANRRSGAPGFPSAVSWPARSEELLLDARGMPDLSSAYAFARSFSCESLRSWACQEANQLCRSCCLPRPMTTSELKPAFGLVSVKPRG